MLGRGHPELSRTRPREPGKCGGRTGARVCGGDAGPSTPYSCGLAVPAVQAKGRAAAHATLTKALDAEQAGALPWPAQVFTG